MSTTKDWLDLFSTILNQLLSLRPPQLPPILFTARSGGIGRQRRSLDFSVSGTISLWLVAVIGNNVLIKPRTFAAPSGADARGYVRPSQHDIVGELVAEPSLDLDLAIWGHRELESQSLEVEIDLAGRDNPGELRPTSGTSFPWRAPVGGQIQLFPGPAFSSPRASTQPLP